MRYDKPEANEWVQPTRKGYRMMCCDCGLVHEMDFRVHKKKVQFRVRRNNRATVASSQRRQSMEIVDRIEAMGGRISKSGAIKVPPYVVITSEKAKAILEKISNIEISE